MIKHNQKEIKHEILMRIASRIGFEITYDEFNQIKKAIDYFNKTYDKHFHSLYN